MQVLGSASHARSMRAAQSAAPHAAQPHRDGAPAAASYTAASQTAATPPALPAYAAGLWAADDDERALAPELDKILQNKPALRPLALPAAAYDGDEWHDEAAIVVGSTTAREAAADEGDHDGTFEWQAAEGEPQSDDAVRTVRSHGRAAAAVAPSLQWMAKARADRRRSKVRHAAGWMASVVVAALIIACAAIVLAGWRPDLMSLVALVQKALI